MDKRKEGIIAIVLLTIIFSSLFVSASIFTDFWGKITGRAMDTPPKGMIPAPNDPFVLAAGCTVNVSACQGDYPEQVMKGSVYILAGETGSISEKYCLLSAYPELGADYRSWPFQGTCAEVKELLDGFCYDSDFGNSAYIAGTTSSSSRDFLKETKQDKCEDTKSLREYYCVPYEVENCRMPTGCIRSELITCPNLCSQGACEKTKSNTGTLKTCAELQGKVCEEGKRCKEDFTESSDEEACCTAECEVIPSNLGKTCSELQGKVCEEGKRCKEDFTESSDEEACCTAECEVIPSNLGKTCSELQGKVCEEGYKCPANDFTIAKDTSECCLKECELIIVDDKCPFSNRQSGKYCAADGKYYSQLEDDSACENNFECQGNLCISGECVSSSFMEKVFDWFRRLFGLKDKTNNNNPPEDKTCEELQGEICEEGEVCSIALIDSSEGTGKCCAGTCDVPTKTCSELKGKVCDEGYKCSISVISSSDEESCCTSECELIEVPLVVSGVISCSPLDSTRIKLEYSYDLSKTNSEVTLFRGDTKVTLLPERKSMIEKIDSDKTKFYQYNVPASDSAKYYNSVDVPSCPIGWTNYKSWLTSESIKCPNWISFCAKCDTKDQSWGDHEKSSCTRPKAGACNAVTCYSKVTQIGCIPSGKGGYINQGLKPSTEYVYYLRDGTSADSPLIAEAVTCKTKETYEEDIEEPELTSQQATRYTCEDCTKYYKQSCDYKYNDFDEQSQRRECIARGITSCTRWGYCTTTTKTTDSCAEDSDCLNMKLGRCSSSKECVQCTDDADCRNFARNPNGKLTKCSKNACVYDCDTDYDYDCDGILNGDEEEGHERIYDCDTDYDYDCDGILNGDEEEGVCSPEENYWEGSNENCNIGETCVYTSCVPNTNCDCDHPQMKCSVNGCVFPDHLDWKCDIADNTPYLDSGLDTGWDTNRYCPGMEYTFDWKNCIITTKLPICKNYACELQSVTSPIEDDSRGCPKQP